MATPPQQSKFQSKLDAMRREESEREESIHSASPDSAGEARPKFRLHPAQRASDDDEGRTMRNTGSLMALPRALIFAPLRLVSDVVLALLAFVLNRLIVLFGYRPHALASHDDKKAAREYVTQQLPMEANPHATEAELPHSLSEPVINDGEERAEKVAGQYTVSRSLAEIIPDKIDSAQEDLDRRATAIEAEIDRLKQNARDRDVEVRRQLQAEGAETAKQGSWRAYGSVLFILALASAPIDYAALTHKLTETWQIWLLTVVLGFLWAFLAHIVGQSLRNWERKRQNATHRTSALVQVIASVVVVLALVGVINWMRASANNETEPVLDNGAFNSGTLSPSSPGSQQPDAVPNTGSQSAPGTVDLGN